MKISDTIDRRSGAIGWRCGAISWRCWNVGRRCRTIGRRGCSIAFWYHRSSYMYNGSVLFKLFKFSCLITIYTIQYAMKQEPGKVYLEEHCHLHLQKSHPLH